MKSSTTLPKIRQHGDYEILLRMGLTVKKKLNVPAPNPPISVKLSYLTLQGHHYRRAMGSLPRRPKNFLITVTAHFLDYRVPPARKKKEKKTVLNIHFCHCLNIWWRKLKIVITYTSKVDNRFNPILINSDSVDCDCPSISIVKGSFFLEPPTPTAKKKKDGCE